VNAVSEPLSSEFHWAAFVFFLLLFFVDFGFVMINVARTKDKEKADSHELTMMLIQVTGLMLIAVTCANALYNALTH